MSSDMDREWFGHYDTAIRLLRQLRRDYQLASNELQEVSSRFGEREAIASRQLRFVMESWDKTEVTDRNWVDDPSRPESEIPLGASEPSSSSPALQVLTPTLEVYCLGAFQVRVGWNRIEHWRNTKAKSLLKCLIARVGRTAAKDALTEALWPGCDPSLANNNLKAAVRCLRETLRSAHDPNSSFEWVHFHDSGYSINTDADLWIDVDQVEYHWQAGRQLERAGKTLEAVREYKTAEALYKGDYLEDDVYEEWTYLRREAVKDAYLAILGKLAEHAIRMADHEGCIAYCQRILAKDPCREDAYRRLMRCHSRLGQRNRAIGWYRICESTVRRELDVSPDRHTTALYRNLLNDEDI